MSSFSAYLEQKIVDWIKGTNMPTAPASIYLALSTTEILDDGSGLLEPTDAAYARQQIALGTRSSANGIGTTVKNSTNIIFPTATADWGLIAYGAIYDALTGGNLISHWQWQVGKTVYSGDTFAISVNDLEIIVR